MGALRFEDDNEIATCDYWVEDAEQGDEGDPCDAPPPHKRWSHSRVRAQVGRRLVRVTLLGFAR